MAEFRVNLSTVRAMLEDPWGRFVSINIGGNSFSKYGDKKTQREEIEVADVTEVIIRNRYQGVTEEVGISVENPEKMLLPERRKGGLTASQGSEKMDIVLDK